MTALGRMAEARRLAESAPVAVALLIGANLVPLVGVLFFGWDLLTIIVLYWIENGIVGLLNVARMIFAAGIGEGPFALAGAHLAGAAKLVLVPFFVVHYGIFWIVHGTFVFALPAIAGVSVGGPVEAYVAIGALALALSHGASFVANYLLRGEYRRASAASLFLAPYGRVVVLHLAILLGAFAVLLAGQPAALIVLLVGGKTVIDLGLHLREHSARRQSPAGSG